MKCFSASTAQATDPNSITGCFGWRGGVENLQPLLSLQLLTLPAAVQTQFEYTSDNGAIIVTGYDCSSAGAAVIIPSTIDGLPVTSIGTQPFLSCSSLTNIMIPNSVASLGWFAQNNAFQSCPSLSAITVEALNSFYSSVDGVLFDKSRETLIQFPEGRAGSYRIPNSVTSIGQYPFSNCPGLTVVTIPDSMTSIAESAFNSCTSMISVTIPKSVTSIQNAAFAGCARLVSVTIPNSVTSIGNESFGGCTSLKQVSIPENVTSIANGAFSGCSSLLSVTIPRSVKSIAYGAFLGCTNLMGDFFKGNAPSVFSDLFVFSDITIAYYLRGTSGWGVTFGGRPAMLWNPLIQTGDSNFGVRANQFESTYTWGSDRVIVVEASTDLTHPAWIPVRTNSLTGSSSYFSDPQWTKRPRRVYRLRAP